MSKKAIPVLVADSIVFDGSAESLAAAINLILSVPARHDFGCRPSNGHCTLECIHRKNVRKIAETALLEYRRARGEADGASVDPSLHPIHQWRH